ncbi:MAG: hydrogenase maturation nickel metallochaperone HypA [Gammaproteobacteria bacterium]|nr:hydrogenase maturation nickel metallochaperone HypA [Gammaproteobacteria bacterium]TVQ48577.1 MAG: hydrogenase maturation nickel metallochaperone HypA [Gammaproteobacteria bacterium]
MHEAGLMRGLMARIQAEAQRAGATEVRRVRVWLGALSQMTPGHFAEHFHQVAPGTLAEHAALDCDCSEDPFHPDAAEVRLVSIDVR